MIMFENVTIWAAIWSGESAHVKALTDVLKYCALLFPNAKTVMLSPVPVPNSTFEVIEIGRLSGMQDWNRFVNYVVPKHINTEYAMSVHADGFPICPDLWRDEFLSYDYIGAPWTDLVVGNGGFNIESRKLLTLKQEIPDAGAREIGSDDGICRTHRGWLEARGIRFAPPEIAALFSTEHVNYNHQPSFGFHGVESVSGKYECGWQILRDRLKWK
jgi:hypothetical protein